MALDSDVDSSNKDCREISLITPRRGTLTLSVRQRFTDVEGAVVWDSALVLAHYFEKTCAKDPNFFANSRVLELGAGTGACGLVAAALGAQSTTLTDLPSLVPLLRENIDRNVEHLSSRVIATRLVWGDERLPVKGYFDVIIAADCVYYEASLGPLLKTILAHSGPATRIFCCYERRDLGKPAEVQQAFRRDIGALFDVCEISGDELDEEFRSEDISLLKLTLKKQQ